MNLLYHPYNSSLENFVHLAFSNSIRLFTCKMDSENNGPDLEDERIENVPVTENNHIFTIAPQANLFTFTQEQIDVTEKHKEAFWTLIRYKYSALLSNYIKFWCKGNNQEIIYNVINHVNNRARQEEIHLLIWTIVAGAMLRNFCSVKGYLSREDIFLMNQFTHLYLDIVKSSTVPPFENSLVRWHLLIIILNSLKTSKTGDGQELELLEENLLNLCSILEMSSGMKSVSVAHAIRYETLRMNAYKFSETVAYVFNYMACHEQNKVLSMTRKLFSPCAALVAAFDTLIKPLLTIHDYKMLITGCEAIMKSLVKVYCVENSSLHPIWKNEFVLVFFFMHKIYKKNGDMDLASYFWKALFETKLTDDIRNWVGPAIA
ncbi:unnamed protein product [Caenorhabditis auriculariae]|uniref:Uncharacterized protein n=1 Tax=Caenorhabditis auriculariae TaxID=2777116 RepID=A0A8S1HGJ9_9PELO|nr:unnamed protein product [Caenorhabditis auriculariae]